MPWQSFESGEQMTAELSSQEKDDLQHVFGLLRPHTPRAMNLADPREHRFVLAQLSHAQLDPTKHLVFQDVENARQQHLATGAPTERVIQQADDAPGTWGTVSMLTSLGFDSHGGINATGLTATASPLTRNSQVLNLYGLDPQGTPSPSLASSSYPDIEGGGTYDELTLSGDSSTFPDRRVVFTNVMVPSADEPATGLKAGMPVVFAQVGTANPGDTESDPSSPIQVTNPVPKYFKRRYVKVALNRDSSQQPDADYWYQTGTLGVLPVVGMGGAGVATWSTNIQTPLSDSDPENFYAYLTLVCPGKGGVSVDNTTSLVKYFTVSGGQLSWDFSPFNFGDVVPWAPGDSVDYYLKVGVMLAGQTDYSEIDVTPASDTSDNGHYQVLPIIFAWGCVARGSAVLMADRSYRAIETVHAGDSVVADSSGRALTVVDTTVGREDGGMIQVGLGSGASLFVTATHPVSTPTGMVMARELAIGDRVNTISGVGRVSSIAVTPEPAEVCNLLLADAASHELMWQDATFIANGLVVGDDRAQSEISNAGRPLPGRHRAAWASHHSSLAERV
jgi:hypothetical protein